MACNPFADGCISREMPEGACTSGADAAKFLLATSMELLAQFICPGSRCEGIVGIISHGAPAVDGQSMVAAWVEPVTPVLSEIPGVPMVLRASVGLQLWLACYPVGAVEGDLYYPPDPAAVSEASAAALTIGQTWYQGLINATAGQARCAGWKVEPLNPLDPAGTMVGWETGFSVAL